MHAINNQHQQWYQRTSLDPRVTKPHYLSNDDIWCVSQDERICVHFSCCCKNNFLGGKKLENFDEPPRCTYFEK